MILILILMFIVKRRRPMNHNDRNHGRVKLAKLSAGIAEEVRHSRKSLVDELYERPYPTFIQVDLPSSFIKHGTQKGRPINDH